MGKYFHLPRLKRVQGDYSIPKEAVQQIQCVTLIPESKDRERGWPRFAEILSVTYGLTKEQTDSLGTRT